MLQGFAISQREGVSSVGQVAETKYLKFPSGLKKIMWLLGYLYVTWLPTIRTKGENANRFINTIKDATSSTLPPFPIVFSFKLLGAIINKAIFFFLNAYDCQGSTFLTIILNE